MPGARHFRRIAVRSHGGTGGEREGGEGGSPHARRLAALLNRSLRVRMSDGRTLVGTFLCTDRDANIILGSAQEFLKAADAFPGSEPRVLGLAMVPGHHIVSIEVERDAAAALCS
uniref:N-alpha-acetyltransferase 38, NatC auxiliary subunit n=1 Tax=Coturnix japonica TaxID=93934 RepID=A0A8C2Y6P8_COTJA